MSSHKAATSAQDKNLQQLSRGLLQQHSMRRTGQLACMQCCWGNSLPRTPAQLLTFKERGSCFSLAAAEVKQLSCLW